MPVWTPRVPLPGAPELLLADGVNPILLADDPGDDSRPILLFGDQNLVWTARTELEDV